MKVDEFKRELNRLVQECESLQQSDELRKGKPEENTKQRLIRPFFESLGYSFIKDVVTEFKVKKKPQAEWVDYAILNDEDVPLLLIEAKSLHEDNLLNYKTELLRYIRDFNKPENKVNKEGFVISWGVLTNFRELHFFHVSEEDPFLSFKYEEYEENAKTIWNLLEKTSLEYDKIALEYKERTKKKLDKDFLDDLKKWRLIIANGFYELQSNLSIAEIKEASQRWIDRLIFIRIFENKGLLPYHWIRKVYTSWKRDTIDKETNPFSEEIRRKFKEFESLYNTELFRPNLCDKLKIDSGMISEVIKVYEEPSREIQKLFESMKQRVTYTGIYGYNFNSLTLDVLGSIYERYLAHNIDVKNDTVVIKETRDLRKKEGVYYTPHYIISCIVAQTLGPKLNEIYQASKALLEKGRYKAAYKKIKEISRIKVLDPACGSGSFLIEAFDAIANCYRKYNEAVGREIKKINKNTRTQIESTSLDGFIDLPISLNEIGKDILLSNIHGVDLDEQAVEITKLNLWRALVLLEPENYSYKKIAELQASKMLPSLENNIKCGDSLIGDFSVSKSAFIWKRDFSSVLEEGGFDIVIGNPPYGAQLNLQERAYIGNNYVSCKSYKNSALAFIERGYSLLKKTGCLGFIVPKSLTFSQGWSEGVNLILSDLKFLIDSSRAFKDVLLEQVVIILDREKATESYETAFFEEEQLSPWMSIPKDTYKNCKTLITSISQEEFQIYKKINAHGNYFKDISITFRGLPWQKYLRKSGSHKMLRGDHIERFGIKESFEYVNAEEIESSKSKRDLLKNPKIISQNIVAHVKKPDPHIIIMSALDKNGCLNLDTVNNTLPTNKDYSLEYMLCILNCSLTSWYAYRFIYNKAIRTMHFDEYYVGRIPIPKVLDQKQFVLLANKMIELTAKKRLLLSAFWKLCKNRKNDDKNLLWLLSNSNFVDAIGSVNINPNSWDEKKFEEFRITKDGSFINVESSDTILFKIAFRDPDLQLYTYFVLKYYDDQRKLRDKNLKALCEYIQIPIIKPNPSVELKKVILSELKKAYVDVDLPTIDIKLKAIDKKIDELVCDLYSLTNEEKEIIER